jgi:succinate dehydrogenase/fumarate reductase flavoprotein subunit
MQNMQNMQNMLNSYDYIKIKKMILNNYEQKTGAIPKVVSYPKFKAVDSRNTVIMATGKYSRPVLKAR